MTDDLVKRLRAGTGGGKQWMELHEDAADRIEELEADNKALRRMLAEVVESTGDDPEIMAASRVEWAQRALAAEARIKELEAKLAQMQTMSEYPPEVVKLIQAIIKLKCSDDEHESMIGHKLLSAWDYERARRYVRANRIEELEAELALYRTPSQN